jgi:hypothetical protein
MAATEKTIDIGHLLGLVSDALGGSACSHLALSCRVGGSAIELTVKPVEAAQPKAVATEAGGDHTLSMDLGGFADRFPGVDYAVFKPKTRPPQPAPAAEQSPAEAPAETVVDLATFDSGIVPPLPASGAGQTDALLPASVRTPPAPEAGEPLASPEPVQRPGKILPVADNPGGASASADAARPLPQPLLPLVERIAASWARGHRSAASIATDINEPIQRVKNNIGHAQKRGLLPQDTTPRVPQTAEAEAVVFKPMWPMTDMPPPPAAGTVAETPATDTPAAQPVDAAEQDGPPDLRCPKEAAIVVAKHGARFYAAGPASPEPCEITRPAYLALRRMAGGQMFGLGTLTNTMGFAADRQDEAKGVLRNLRAILAGHGVVMTESPVG